MNAEQMFTELGFRKCEGVYREGETLLYEKNICDGRDVLYVRFLHGMVRVTELANYVYNIDGKLMKAIYKQMEELGWMDSERKAIYHLTKFEYDLLNEDKESTDVLIKLNVTVSDTENSNSCNIVDSLLNDIWNIVLEKEGIEVQSMTSKYMKEKIAK